MANGLMCESGVLVSSLITFEDANRQIVNIDKCVATVSNYTLGI